MIWPAEAIWEAVSPLLPGFTVEVLPEIDSTNTELMRRAHAGQIEPVLLVAERQTAGRGRLGRDWSSETLTQGRTLTFSLGLPLAPADWSGLSLAVGLSVVQSLHPQLRLKWPNDVWLHDRKLAGILIETASVGQTRYVVIGVGINMVAPDATGLRTLPAGLREVLPQVRAPDVLEHLMLPLVQAVQRFGMLGFAPLVGAFAARDVLQGREVVCSDGLTGMARGVDASGALLVHTASGVRKITSAEVSVRPVSLGDDQPQ
ncbi:MAG: biotin--[acetyl-CoA-carboxylase] ligase [Burkholderiales bacterium]|nr:biotin--[acetyl-CoA-carboxylase] ligase [Burkholderiales bacterium]